MGGFYNSGVPSSAELDYKNSKKYTVNRDYRDGILIPRSLCALMAIGAILLAVITALLVFFLVPRCTNCEETTTKEVPKIGEQLMKDAVSNSIFTPLTKDFKSEDKDERLPRSISPRHYRLQIIPFIENSTIEGTETITFHVDEATNNIIFNLKDLKIDTETTKLSSEKGDVLKIKEQSYIDGEQYKITVDDTLQQNSLYYLDFMFTGYLNGQLRGLYRSEYQNLDEKFSHLACTQFSPNDARRAFPCFDEPSFKAKFSISIGRRKNMTAISNMPRMGKPEPFFDDNDWVWDHFQETPEMSTYLVAFIVSDLKPSQGIPNDFIQIWAQQASVHRVGYAKMMTPQLLHFYENYTKVKFPLPKLDMVAVPDFGFHGMENWGLITFRESALLFDVHMSDMDNLRDVALIVAHELAHQWFGNLVTPKWWDDVWLKEGFSTYMQYLGVNKTELSWNILQEFMSSETNVAFGIDALRNARALSSSVLSNRQVRQSFDRLPYSKGASIVRMMNNFLGEETFRNGIEKYLNTYMYKNANQNDLFEILTEEARNMSIIDYDVTVTAIMDKWMHEPGFPVISVSADRKNESLVLTIYQNRFLYVNTKEEESHWWIPISITTDFDDDFDTMPDVWMKGEQQIKTTIEADRWYLLNLHHTGYYIVNYDRDNWEAFMDMEVFMNFPPTVRAQLISNAMDLARAGLLDYHIPLMIIGKMALNDTDIMYAPTLAALEKLQYVYDMLITTEAFKPFEKYINTVFMRAFKTVTFGAAGINEYLVQRILKLILNWTCRDIKSMCVTQSLEKFKTMETYPIQQNIRNIVYCTALKFGSIDDWYFAYKRYLITKSPSEKNVLLDALGCTSHHWLLSSYLEHLTQTNSSIHMQDAVRVFTSVANNHNGYRVALNFLKENWHQLTELYGDGGYNILGKMIKSVSKYLNTEYQLKELINFRKTIKGNIGPAEYAFDSAIEEVQANVYWMKVNYKSLEDWLNMLNKHFSL